MQIAKITDTMQFFEQTIEKRIKSTKDKVQCKGTSKCIQDYLVFINNILYINNINKLKVRTFIKDLSGLDKAERYFNVEEYTGMTSNKNALTYKALQASKAIAVDRTGQGEGLIQAIFVNEIK